MSRTVSSVALQAMLSRETAEVFLIAMRIAHADFGTLRIVNNTESVVRTDGTYVPFPFSITLPAETDEQVPQVTVVFDNIDETIVDAIRTVTGARPTVSFDVILASSPNTVEAGPFNFSIMSAQYDVKQVTCTLGFEEDILNQQAPRGNYSPSNSPGLFV
jgi:hypothetical protein